MLKKLFRQEWIATTKILLPINLLLIVITLFGSFISRIFLPDSENALVQGLSISALMLCICALIGVTCAAYIYIVLRFYKTMYSDEGYLTHTLPISVHTLIIGKGLTATIWLCITHVMLFVSAMFLVFSQFDSGELRNAYQEFLTFLAEYKLNSPMPFSILICLIPVAIVVNALYSFLNVSASLAIGQLITKHKIIGSILAFCGIYTIVQVISLFIFSFTNYFSYMVSSAQVESIKDMVNYVFFSLGTSIGMTLLLCVVFYVTTWQLTSRKLNLD